MQKWNEEEGRTPGAFHNIGFDHNEGTGNLCGAQTQIGWETQEPRERYLDHLPSLNTWCHLQKLAWNLGEINMVIVATP